MINPNNESYCAWWPKEHLKFYITDSGDEKHLGDEVYFDEYLDEAPRLRFLSLELLKVYTVTRPSIQTELFYFTNEWKIKMISTIDKTHPIFCSSEYLCDIVPFTLMEVIKNSPKLLASNEKNFIIGLIAPQIPIWVWTSKTIDNYSLGELCEYFYHKFSTNNSIEFVAKPNISDVLVKPFLNNKRAVEHRVAMESYENVNVIPAKNKDILIERPTITDIDQIAFCMANFDKDCFGKDVSCESFINKAKQKIDSPDFYVIKQNGIVVATAQSSIETNTHIAMNRVYTLPEYRGNGYASALVAYISDLILKKGKIPALYADLSNPSSNKVYKTVGFIEKGKVDQVILTWN